MGQVLHIKQIHLVKAELQKLWLGEDKIRDSIVDLLQRVVMKRLAELLPNLIVALVYGKGVTAGEQYHCRINAEKFSSFIHGHFARMFKKPANPREKLFLKDDDLSKNSVKSRTTWDKIGAQKFTIPARSPDLSPSSILLRGICIQCLGTGHNPRKFRLVFKTSEGEVGCRTIGCSG